MQRAFETLENRRLFAVTASFTPATGLFSVIGDNLDNTITISRNAAGQILVNGGAVAVAGGTPTVANTSLMQVFGLGGHDSITLNEASGALPGSQLFGGTGNDTLTGGSGADLLFGQGGNDALLGKGGVDQLFGGTENDALTGGDADDQVFGESGDDRMIWNPGDDTDLNEGGAGTDTVEVNGGNGAEQFSTTANGTRVRFDRLNPAPFSIDIGTSENLFVNMNGGDDTFSATGNLAALIRISTDGGAGNDSILGSNGVDLLIGGDGDDFIDGQQGNDVALMGAGDDVFQWDPGDGSDTIEGQADLDTMVFFGSNASENVNVFANGGRTLFTRDIANITMDMDDVETVNFRALGGADNIIVGDLTGTDTRTVSLDLGGPNGGGDGTRDSITVNGTNGEDVINFAKADGGSAVAGLFARTEIYNMDRGLDAITINALGGNDVVDFSRSPINALQYTFNGGLGNDVLIGLAGNDFFNGGDGSDVALMGSGDDTFTWNPGDDNDVLEGQAGFDTMLFNGANVSENIDISRNGGRVIFFRNIANVLMDLNDTEAINFNALGGADTIVANDLSGTNVIELNLNLAGTGNTGDAAADHVIVNTTNADDVVLAVGDAAGTSLLGLAAQVNITGAEAANDRLTVNLLAGDDVLEASGLKPGAIALTGNGGDDDDVLVGGDNADILTGGNGDDVLVGGLGLDILDGGIGDNVVIQ